MARHSVDLPLNRSGHVRVPGIFASYRILYRIETQIGVGCPARRACPPRRNSHDICYEAHGRNRTFLTVRTRVRHAQERPRSTVRATAEKRRLTKRAVAYLSSPRSHPKPIYPNTISRKSQHDRSDECLLSQSRDAVLFENVLKQGSVPQRKLSIEDKILLACSRRSLPAKTIARVQQDYLTHEIDWHALIARAQEHAVLLLVHQNFRTHFSHLIPKSVMQFLHEASSHYQRRNLALTGELFRILAMLEAMGIEAIPFKGPALAMTAYGSLSLRMFADLDILIRDEDLDRSREALIASGYVAEFTFTEKQERNYRKAECAVQLRHPERNSVVELHWRLTERYLSIDFEMDQIWQRRSETRIQQRLLKSMAPEDLFLYVCVHGSKHHWERLEWLCCVTELAAANPSVDWMTISERARRYGIERVLNMALLLAQDLLDMPLPEQLKARAQADVAARRLAEEAAAELISEGSRTGREHMNRGDWYLNLLRMRERWSDRLRILAYSSVRLPHPDSREFVNLPAKLDFLYYVLRPVRLVGSTLWTALCHVGLGRKHLRNGTSPGAIATLFR